MERTGKFFLPRIGSNSTDKTSAWRRHELFMNRVCNSAVKRQTVCLVPGWMDLYGFWFSDFLIFLEIVPNCPAVVCPFRIILSWEIVQRRRVLGGNDVTRLELRNNEARVITGSPVNWQYWSEYLLWFHTFSTALWSLFAIFSLSKPLINFYPSFQYFFIQYT